MGTRKQDTAALLDRCETDIARVEQEYTESLHERHVGSGLKVDVKNLCENMRSALDYIAHDIRDTYCGGANPRSRFYFPIFETRAAFDSQVEAWYPGLKATAPELWNYLEGIQPYQAEYGWLGTFNSVNNQNKHGNLVAQTRTETEQVRVSTQGGGSVTWTPQNVKFGSGVYIGGVPVNPSTQMPVPHSSQKVEKVTWVDFRFVDEEVSALGLLRQTLVGVQRIVADVDKWL